MKAGRALGAAAALAAWVQAAPDSGWSRLAVIVTSQAGLAGDAPLLYSHRDGAKLRGMLLTLGQVPAGNLFWAKADRAPEARAALEAAKARIAALKKEGRRIFVQFYYSGHGAARHFHLGGERMSFDEVRAGLAGPEARMYVLDVCYGASFFAAKGFHTAPPLRLQIDLDQTTRGEIVISSSALEEQAFEVKTLGGSVFTSHWAMALRGAGDRNRDGQVTLFEAYNYAYDRTVAYSAQELNRPQHPSFDIDLTGARDLLLSRPRNLPSGIVFSGCPPGRYSLVDQTRGLAVGEVGLPEAGDFSLALEAGRYRVSHHPAAGPEVAAQAQVPSQGMQVLRAGDFQASTARAGAPKGGVWEDPTRPFLAWLGTAVWFSNPAWTGAFPAGAISTPAERNFSVEGDYRAQSRKPAFGAQLALAHSPLWKLGLDLETWEQDHHRSGLGREFLVSPDSVRSHPVQEKSVARRSSFAYGVFFAASPLEIGPVTWDLDLGWRREGRRIRLEREITRPLYNLVHRETAEYEGEGHRWRAGTGLTYWLPFGLGFWRAGLSGQVGGLYAPAIALSGVETSAMGERESDWKFTARAGLQIAPAPRRAR